ncbi:MAG: TlpA disulfide reductase family protein [Candidatus Caldarchaeum sp.]
MKKKAGHTRYLAAVPAVALVALVLFLTLTPPSPQSKVVVSTAAPPFSLEEINADGLTGRVFSSTSLKGKPTLIEFVFEWCPHCNRMVPTVEALHERYGDKVFFLTVLGSQGTTPQKSAEFLKKHGIGWTAVYDPTMKVFLDYGVRGTPTYFFIRPDGTIMRKLEGEQSYDVLSRTMEELLSGL